MSPGILELQQGVENRLGLDLSNHIDTARVLHTNKTFNVIVTLL